MKVLKVAFLSAVTFFSFQVSAQESEQQDAAQADTTKTWTIKGENTFLLNQSSF